MKLLIINQKQRNAMKTWDLDHFILTFSDNSPRIITNKKGTQPCEHFMDMTFQEAEFVDFVEEGFEVAIPIGTFLQIKDNPNFQSLCKNLVRLRMTPRTLLCVLVHPINHIDNRIN